MVLPMTRSSQRSGIDAGRTQLASLPRTMAVTANSFIAMGGNRFTVFKEGQNPNTLGSDLDAPEAYIDGLPSPFEAPNPNSDPRITRQG